MARGTRDATTNRAGIRAGIRERSSAAATTARLTAPAGCLRSLRTARRIRQLRLARTTRRLFAAVAVRAAAFLAHAAHAAHGKHRGPIISRLTKRPVVNANAELWRSSGGAGEISTLLRLRMAFSRSYEFKSV